MQVSAGVVNVNLVNSPTLKVNFKFQHKKKNKKNTSIVFVWLLCIWATCCLTPPVKVTHILDLIED